MKDKVFELTHVKEEEFIKYCKDRKLFYLSSDVRKEFFRNVIEKRIVRNSKTGELEDYEIKRPKSDY